MAWNEPGGGKDPWGGKRNNDGPPDLDEALNALKKKFPSIIAFSSLKRCLLVIQVVPFRPTPHCR